MPRNSVIWPFSEPGGNNLIDCIVWNTEILNVSCHHITYAFQSESTLYICLNVKEFLAQNRRDIWSFKWLQRDSNPEPLNRLAKLAKRLSCVVSTCLYGAFDCNLLSCHVCISQHSSIFWPVWPNSWVFLYELSGSGFESRCSHLKLQISRLFWARNSLTFRQI